MSAITRSLGLRDTRERKRFKGKEHLLDHMGSTELALDATLIGPMDKRGDSWASVTLQRTAAMEKYRRAGSEEEGREQNGK
jgi:hypothetical protein